MILSTTKKTALLIASLVTLGLIAFTITSAQAGSKRHFGGKYYKNPYLLKNHYVCKPQYIKKWVWNKYKNRKVRRLIRIQDRCNVYYR